MDILSLLTQFLIQVVLPCQLLLCHQQERCVSASHFQCTAKILRQWGHSALPCLKVKPSSSQFGMLSVLPLLIILYGRRSILIYLHLTSPVKVTRYLFKFKCYYHSQKKTYNLPVQFSKINCKNALKVMQRFQPVTILNIIIHSPILYIIYLS